MYHKTFLEGDFHLKWILNTYKILAVKVASKLIYYVYCEYQNDIVIIYYLKLFT